MDKILPTTLAGSKSFSPRKILNLYFIEIFRGVFGNVKKNHNHHHNVNKVIHFLQKKI